MNKIYINVQGGTGLNIALASVLSLIQEKKPGEYEFSVLSPYCDIFECCDAVKSVYKPNEIRDFIFDAEREGAEILMHRIYDMDGFIKKQLNYESAWWELICKEKIDSTALTATSKLNPLKKFYGLRNNVNDVLRLLKEKKFDDFIITQFTGGQSPLVQVPPMQNEKGQTVPNWNAVPYNYDNEPLKRHYPTEKAQQFAELFHKAHPKTAVISFQLPNEPSIGGDFVVRGTMPYLAYYELAKLPECRGVVAIDSCLQHLVAGVTKSVILWAHSVNADDEKVYQMPFGYVYNTNIIQPCRRNDILFFTALGPSGARVNYIEPNTLLSIVNNELFNADSNTAPYTKDGNFYIEGDR